MSAARIPIEAQQSKLDRLLDERIAHYRRAVNKGTRSLEWASAKQAECEALRASFAFLVSNADWIRPEAQRRARAARLEAEAATLRDDPAAAAVLDAFPGAEIVDVKETAA